MKSFGLDVKRELAEQSPKDWEFQLGGLNGQCITAIPEQYRESYLPQGQIQRGAEDWMCCATMSVLNILEVKFNWLLRENVLTADNRKWLVDNGYMTESGIAFSDRFTSILSGTTRTGNSLKNPCEAVRVHGLIPKPMLPADTSMTWQEFHNESKITPKMRKLGKEFAERFHIGYERVYDKDFGDILRDDMVDVGGYAWPAPKNGVYPRVQYTPNHAFMIYKNAFHIFDNYLDEGRANDFTKHLARDYNFLDYGYRIFISSQAIKQTSLWQDLLSWFLSYFSR